MIRGYCWRIGHAIEIAVPCPECGSKVAHAPLEAQDECGSFARCSVSDFENYVGRREHGHPCTLPPGHNGKHLCDEASVLCMQEHLAFVDSTERLSRLPE